MAFARLERIGYERSDLYARAASGADADVFAYEPEPEQSPQEMLQAMEFLAMAGNDWTPIDGDHISDNR